MTSLRADPGADPAAEPSVAPRRQLLVAAATLVGLYLVVFGPSVLASARAAFGATPGPPTGGWDRVAAVEADVFSVVVVLVVVRWLSRHAPDVTRRMGLHRPSWPVFLGAAAAYVTVVLIATRLGDRLATALGLTSGTNGQVGEGPAGVVLGTAAGVAAGITEELVLLALASAVIARACTGRRSRWLVPVTLAVLVVLRWLPHTYYLGGSVFVALWVPGAYLLWRRVGSVWPLVVGHAAYDVLAVIGHAYPAAGRSVDVVLWLVAAAGVFAVAASHRTNRDVSRPARG